MTMKERIFDHVVIVMVENEYRGLVLQNETMRRIAELGADMTNYYGTFHPSQTNYIASIASEQCAWANDDPVWPLLRQNTIVDLLEASGLEWKAYMEGMPTCPWNPAWATPAYYEAAERPSEIAPPDSWPAQNPGYWQKHNPFASFLSIQFQMSRWQRIVGLEQFFRDVEEGTLPHYSWITPNIWNDGHYLQDTQESPKDRSILIDQIADWLRDDFFGRLGFPGADSQLPPRTLVVVTFDESDFEDTVYEGPNRIYTVLLGDMVRPGTRQPEPYNHYSLLRTIEENFGLGTLAKNDAGSNWLRFLWRERFSWDHQHAVPASTSGTLAAAAWHDLLMLVTQDSRHLVWQTLDGDEWTEPARLEHELTGPFALAGGGELLLVYSGADHQLFALPYLRSSGWARTPVPLGVECGGSLALTALPGGGGFMLAYTEPGQGHELPIRTLMLETPLLTRISRPGHALGRLTAGGLALSILGSAVYLVYTQAQQPGSTGCRMLVTSFETAEFNTIVAGEGTSSTVAYHWAPAPTESPAPDGSTYVVGEVEQHSKVVDSPPPANPTWITPCSPLAMAELDGCMRLIATSASSGSLFSESFSLSGIMTSKLPTRLEYPPPEGYGNGWGTLMEAGWGPVENLSVRAHPEGPIALATYRGAQWLFYVCAESGGIRTAVGRWVSG